MIFPTKIHQHLNRIGEIQRLIGCLCLIVLMSCFNIDQSYAQSKDSDFVVVVSLGAFVDIVKDIVGADITVKPLLSSSRDPHHYAVRPSDLSLLKKADAILWMGSSLEPQLVSQVTLSGNSALAIDEVSGLEWLDSNEKSHKPTRHGHNHHGHAHHDDHNSDHAGDEEKQRDPHIWLSIKNRPVLIQEIAAWLLNLVEDPMSKNRITQNSRRLLMSWKEKSNLWIQETAHMKASSLIVDHNAYQYLLTDLNLNLAGIIQPMHGVKPSIKHLLKLKKAVIQQRVSCVLVSPEVNPRFVKKIDNGSELQLIELNPMMTQKGNIGRGGHFKESQSEFDSIEAMDHIVQRIVSCKV